MSWNVSGCIYIRRKNFSVVSVLDSPSVRYEKAPDLVMLPYYINFRNVLQLTYEHIRSASSFLCDHRFGLGRMDLPKSTSRVAQLSVHSWLALIERLWGDGGNSDSSDHTDCQSFGNHTCSITCYWGHHPSRGHLCPVVNQYLGTTRASATPN